jgi:beta-lactamase class A
MKRIGRFSIFRWMALALIVAAVALLVFQLVVFSRLRSSFPAGTRIAGVDVTGLSMEQAATRVSQVYSIPIEMRYNENIIQVKPSNLGFKLDLTAMMTAADQARAAQPFWTAFFAYLFNQLPPSVEVPLRADIDEDRIRSYLENDISVRYDQGASAYEPVPGSVNFFSVNPGQTLDLDRSVALVSNALRSPTARSVNLVLVQGAVSRPSMQELRVLLQQIVDVNEFTGVVEIYMQDLNSGADLQVAYSNGEVLTPGIAFSADSTIKIAVMVTAYRFIDEPASEEVAQLVQEMIAKSDNVSTDALMIQVLDRTLGPLEVTRTMKALGLTSTYLDGMFYVGAPLLSGGVTTPANTREDVDTEPDPYNQTTPTEIGMLLTDIYQCAQYGGGSLLAVFPGEITQSECRSMITYLTQNRIGVLIEAGLPDGTQVGHKHGWAIDPLDGLMHTVGDAGLVYTPGGNYVLAIFIHNTDQIVWDNANQLYADLSRAVYNYFNLGAQ